MTSLEPTYIDVPVPGGSIVVGRWASGEQSVIAAHGITASSMSWRPVARYLERDYTLLAPDLRGRGASARLPGPWGLARHADDLLAIADHLGIRSVVLAGESMGAFVVVVAAARRPDLARHVVLVDGGLPLQFPEGADPDAILEAMLGPVLGRLRRTFPSVEAYYEFWREHPAMAGTWNDDVEAYLRYDLTGDAPVLRPAASEQAVRADARDLFNTAEIAAALRSLTCPVVHLRAERGLNDLPPGLQPAELVAAWRLQIADFTDLVVEDTNHYSIAFGDAGAREIAGRIAQPTDMETQVG
jgi:pimeloyl-ACP methyl ester carboxylesterase